MTAGEQESSSRPNQSAVNWMHDQLGQLKTLMSRLQQQGDQTQAALLDVNEKLREADSTLRELGGRTIGLPAVFDQLRQVAGLLDRIQDAEVLIDTKFEILERQGGERRDRDQAEKNDLFRRIQDAERRIDALIERQASGDDAARRAHEEISRGHIQFQGINQRLDGVETKAARAIDSIARLEQQHGESESAIRALRREDDALEERARVSHEIASRVETEFHAHREEHRALPLLAERVELLRVERQRLDDRTSRIEASLEDARSRLEREEETSALIDKRMKAHDARIDHAQNSMVEFQRTLTEQLLKLNQMLERMRRRHVEELEREIKELRVQANILKNPDE